VAGRVPAGFTSLPCPAAGKPNKRCGYEAGGFSAFSTLKTSLRFVDLLQDQLVESAHQPVKGPAKVRKRPTSANAPTAVAAACETPLITPIENRMKLQDGTRAAARKSFKDQSDGFIADFNL
jgi:hypothetical protein